MYSTWFEPETPGRSVTYPNHTTPHGNPNRRNITIIFAATMVKIILGHIYGGEDRTKRKIVRFYLRVHFMKFPSLKEHAI